VCFCYLPEFIHWSNLCPLFVIRKKSKDKKFLY
jgi:hypothetical protein